jgi:hypothetical protein
MKENFNLMNFSNIILYIQSKYLQKNHERGTLIHKIFKKSPVNPHIKILLER